MNKENKTLLLKDLCARLPYRVIVQVKDWTTLETELELGHIQRLQNEDLELKPYLRSMSSMTKEEKEEFENLLEGIVDGVERWDKPDLCEEYDWLNAHYFDYRGLIPKGLALEAHEGMY